MAEKFIRGKEELEYKARFKQFLKELYPNQLTEEQIEKLRQEYLAKRVKK